MGLGFAVFAGTTPEIIRASAREAERLGVNSFWVNHPGSTDGLAALAHAARETRRLELGIGVIEVMPIAAFDGVRGWGYDGVSLFAPHEPYGGPEAFKRLVDSAHARGLGVVLDVVYNHFGPTGNHLNKKIVGDPVSIDNGNVTRDEQDLQSPGVGLPLILQRHYDSQSDLDRGMGPAARGIGLDRGAMDAPILAETDRQRGPVGLVPGIGRKEADQEGRRAHQADGDEERALTAEAVADHAEDQRAQRAEGKAGGEQG